MVSNQKNISEVSFGSGKILNDLIEFSNIQTNSNNKIVFIGDTAQLTPIDMSFSPALSPKYLEKNFDIISNMYASVDLMIDLHNQNPDRPVILNKHRWHVVVLSPNGSCPCCTSPKALEIPRGPAQPVLFQVWGADSSRGPLFRCV